jgi:hypothetical protein
MNRTRFFNSPNVLLKEEWKKDSVGVYLDRVYNVSGNALTFKHYILNTAINVNGSTSTTAASGSTAETFHATGRGLIFKSNGTKWLSIDSAQDIFDIGDLPAGSTVTANDLFLGLQRVKATGTWTPTANATANQTIIIGGVTFVAKASASLATEFTIGAGATGSDTNLGITLFNLLAKLNASVDTTVDDVTYTDNHTSTNKDGTAITFTHDKPGTEGNSFPTVVGTWPGVMSGTTLSGGTETLVSFTKAQITA